MIAGTFDNFHVGHQWLIAQALDASDNGEIVIIVARDKTVERIKGRIPRNNELSRLEMIQRFVSFEPEKSNIEVRLGRADADFMKTMEEELSDILLLGYDQKVDPVLFEVRFPRLIVRRSVAYKPEIFKSSKFGVQ